MQSTANIRIDVEAAKALVDWKAIFAEEVFEQAQCLAAQSDDPSLVTLPHYRQAAKTAIQSLSAAILSGDEHDGERDVA